MSNPQRIGVYGGTFDPIHTTHLEIARTALREAKLDFVLFVVAASPPHKRGEVFAEAEDRLAMVEAVVAGEPGMQVSRVEFEREGPSYTVDTLEQLHGEYPEARFFLILGSDSLLDFPRWRKPQRMLELAEILVAKRPGAQVVIPPMLEGRCHVLPFEENAASSTAIRERLGRCEVVDGLLPLAAERVIRERGLYRACCEKPAG